MSTDPLREAREIMKQQSRDTGQRIIERWHNHPSLDVCIVGRCPGGGTHWDGHGLIIDHFAISTAAIPNRQSEG